MTYSVRNWHKFQHFKDRRPPWIKLHRTLFDDPDFNEMPAEDARQLVKLWLVASESMNGELPCLRKLAYRFRISEPKMEQLLTRLSHWLYQDDINSISDQHQVGPPETETETETDLSSDPNGRSSGFDLFWQAYPKKEGKKAAEKAFRVALRETSLPTILEALEKQKKQKQQWREARFIPLPTTWLNQGRWADEVSTALKQTDDWRKVV